MELFNKEGHLTDEGLRAVVDGTLDEMGRLEASEHLSFCDSCLVRYTELLADDTLLVPEMPLTPTVLARVRRRAVRVFFNRYTRVAAVAAFAVVLWGTVLGGRRSAEAISSTLFSSRKNSTATWW